MDDPPLFTDPTADISTPSLPRYFRQQAVASARLRNAIVRVAADLPEHRRFTPVRDTLVDAAAGIGLVSRDLNSVADRVEQIVTEHDSRVADLNRKIAALTPTYPDDHLYALQPPAPTIGLVKTSFPIPLARQKKPAERLPTLTGERHRTDASTGMAWLIALAAASLVGFLFGYLAHG